MRFKWPTLVVILLVAAALRLVDLDGAPPGLEHDEVANWLIDREILSGHHAVYFEEAYGHEAGYHYLQAASVALLGDRALSLRLPSAFAGLIGIAVSFSLARKLFGGRVALINAGLLGGLFWSLFFSRLGVRAILLPVVSGLSAWFFWRGVKSGPCQAAMRDLSLAGALAGASLYTYMAARAAPLIYAAFFAYLALFQRRLLRQHWRGLVLFVACFLLVVAPLAGYLVAHPGAEYRISEIDQPLQALAAGDLRPVVENGLKLLGFFGISGDPLIRQNLPGRPVFDPVGALLFYSGVLLALWRWRRPEYAFCVLWVAISLVPSLVTADAPSSIRCVNAMVFAGCLVGLPLDHVLQSGRWRRAAVVGSAAWLILAAGWTVRDYVGRWVQEEEVHFVWQTALWEAAADLDRSSDNGPVVVAGWTPDSMDPPTMALYLQRSDLSLRFIDPMQALLAPQEGGCMVRPAVLPIDPLLAAMTAEWGWQAENRGSYVVTHLSTPDPAEYEPTIWFDNGVGYAGFRVEQATDGVAVLSFWRASGPVTETTRVFCHLLDDAGATVAQDDGLGAPAGHWGEGDLIAQLHRVAVPSGSYRPRIGLYNPQTGRRVTYSSDAGPADSLLLERIAVP